MTLEETLVQRLIDDYKLRGKNIQGILDNQLFKDLPLDKKVAFITKFSESLKQEPTFNWTAVGLSSLKGAGAGVFAGLATTLPTLATGGKINPLSLKIGAMLGAVSSGGIEAYWQKRQHKFDLNTSKNIDDAIGTLVSRSQLPDKRPAMTPGVVNYLSKINTMGPMVEKAILLDQENYRNRTK